MVELSKIMLRQSINDIPQRSSIVLNPKESLSLTSSPNKIKQTLTKCHSNASMKTKNRIIKNMLGVVRKSTGPSSICENGMNTDEMPASLHSKNKRKDMSNYKTPNHKSVKVLNSI